MLSCALIQLPQGFYSAVSVTGVFVGSLLYKNYDNDSTFNVGGDGCQRSKKLLIMIL